MSVKEWYEARFCGWPLDAEANQICGVAQDVHYDFTEDAHPFESITLAMHKIHKLTKEGSAKTADRNKEEA